MGDPSTGPTFPTMNDYVINGEFLYLPGNTKPYLIGGSSATVEFALLQKFSTLEQKKKLLMAAATAASAIFVDQFAGDASLEKYYFAAQSSAIGLANYFISRKLKESLLAAASYFAVKNTTEQANLQIFNYYNMDFTKKLNAYQDWHNSNGDPFPPLPPSYYEPNLPP